MSHSFKTAFAAVLSSILLTTAFPVWAQGPSPEALQCASLLAGTQVLASQPLIDAMNWQGPRAAGRNFFFEEEGFAKATQMLKTSGPADDVNLWAALNGVGFNSLMIIKSADGGEILAQGRLVPGQTKPDFAGDKIVVKQVGLFTVTGIIHFSVAQISSRTQISIANVPFEIPTNLRDLNSNSEFATVIGIPFLERFVSIANLVENVIANRLPPVAPSDRPGTEWNKAVYLSFSKNPDRSYFESFKGQALKIDQEPIFLLFSNNLLNRQDFWINEGWDLGQFTKTSIYVNHPDFRKALYLNCHASIWGSFRPEIVFAEDIPFSSLQRIYVRPGSRIKILEKLRAQLSPAQASVVERLILEHN